MSTLSANIPSPSIVSVVATLSDGKLLEKCEFYGLQARKWRDRFLGLLPEVQRRGLFREKGFGSIFEFAFRLGGVSKEQVERVLRVEAVLSDKPVLHGLLVNGEVSVNKIARVVSIATVENDDELSDRVKLLPQDALETFVRDVRMEQLTVDKCKISETGAFERSEKAKITDDKAVRPQKSTSQCEVKITQLPDASVLELGQEVVNELVWLKRQGFDLNELLKELLEKRKQEIAEEKETIAREVVEREIVRDASGAAHSEHVPAKVRRVLEKEYGKKCAIPHCHKPSEEVHHAARQSLSRSHNPYYLAPLCKAHHVLAHSMDVKYQESRKKG